MQVLEDLVGHLHGENTLSFQYVMEMWLADPGDPRKTAFRGFAASDPMAQVFDEPLLKLAEGHVGRQEYFLPK